MKKLLFVFIFCIVAISTVLGSTYANEFVGGNYSSETLEGDLVEGIIIDVSDDGQTLYIDTDEDGNADKIIKEEPADLEF